MNNLTIRLETEKDYKAVKNSPVKHFGTSTSREQMSIIMFI